MNTLTIESPESISNNSGMEYKSYNSGLRALLSMRDARLEMEKHYAQMNRIEQNMEALEKKVRSDFEGQAESFEKTNKVSIEIKDAVTAVIKALNNLKEKIAEKNRTDSTELWNRFDNQLDRLRSSIKSLNELSDEGLSESLRVQKEGTTGKYGTNLLSSIVSYARSCKVELQMLERYTPEELNMITQMVLSKIPNDFTVEEAEEYEKDYLSALKDFKKEFSEKKNLWDTFLDILAGGVHQSPSEHVMMERWVEGEKGTL
ncbi:MAG: hypothetical protein Q8K92_13730 [Leadbetterella sp.]|nr:hypothetical protein [Leadbetterella sp.]